MDKCEIEVHLNPGQGIEEICQQIPNNIKPNSIVIISAGTNDLYRTKYHTIKNGI